MSLDEREPRSARTEGQKASVLGRVLKSWLSVPNMRLGQLITAAIALENLHLSQVTDTDLAQLVEEWVEDYR